MLSSRNPFDDIVAIDSVTGIVSLMRPLDREARDQHAVIIVASDMVRTASKALTLVNVFECYCQSTCNKYHFCCFCDLYL